MATITGLTAERMKEIEDATIIEANIVGGNLILTKHDGTTFNAGPVIGPPGPVGPQGPVAISAIPGEVKLWPCAALPVEATYGKWVWADGQDYANADHPKAAAHLAPVGPFENTWKTFDGASNPGASRFRVPDLRGLAPAGLDTMPSPSARGRSNRMTRADAIIFAKRTGREVYDLKMGEMPKHNHGYGAQDDRLDNSVAVSVAVSGSIAGSAGGGAHQHYVYFTYNVANVASGTATGRMSGATANPGLANDSSGWSRAGDGDHNHSVGGSFSGGGSGSGTISPRGSDGAHENVQPTVMVPYMVYLDVV
jgi:microcystin-dependent protein